MESKEERPKEKEISEKEEILMDLLASVIAPGAEEKSLEEFTKIIGDFFVKLIAVKEAKIPASPGPQPTISQVADKVHEQVSLFLQNPTEEARTALIHELRQYKPQWPIHKHHATIWEELVQLFGSDTNTQGDDQDGPE